MSYKNESKSESKNGDDEHSNELSSWQHIEFKEIELGDRIGGGGIGVIYKGWWKDEQVALKTLFDSRINGDLKNEYMDELIVMSKVKHSNIVDFKGACMTPPNFLFVMEMCETSLHDILHVRREIFTERENINMLVDIASALEYLHSQKPAIIHRDIKTLNILRSFDGPLKLCDFGLVKVQNTRAGTPSYMAPELFEGKPFNKSVDTYALGIIMWEIFARDQPWSMMNVQDIRDKVCSGGRPRILSYGIPPRLSTLMTRCWAHKIDERPDISEVVDELLEILDSIPDMAHTTGLDDGGDALGSLMHK